MPVSLASSRALFPLRVKFDKTTLFVPVQSSTPLTELRAQILQALISTGHTPPASTGYTSYEELDAEKDLGLFHGNAGSASGSAVAAVGADAGASSGGNASVAGGSVIFENVEEKDASRGKSVGTVGWKDEVNNVTYLGFRVKGSKSISKPEVQIPSLMDDEEEEDVMDTDLSIPT